MSESLLSRRLQLSSFPETTLTSVQSEADGLVTHFVDEAADLKTLASLTAGGLAYRYGKTAVLSSQLSVLSKGMILPSLVRGGSIAFGLVTEVTAFEFTHRFLTTLVRAHGPAPLQNQ